MVKLKAVDLFCGAGGASTGLVRACEQLGIELDLLAINHWPTAVQTHLLNHPGVRHMCEAVEKIDPRAEIPGGRLHLLLAGPECTHFSTARGGRPVNPQSRASAWHIAKWAQELYIDTILIENVPEFRTWGPIGADFKPLKSKKGETFKAFIEVLKSLGYKVEVKVLNAADFGDPTTRQRLFILARRGKHQINWPEATHSKTGSATLFGGRKRWKAAREIIDWSIEGKSIFNRKKPLRPATIARILAGLEKFGGPELKPFLVVLRNNQDAQSIEGPVPTLTTSGANVGMAQPFMVPFYGEREGQDPRTHSIDQPVPVLPATPKFGLVEPMVMGQQSNAAARPVDQPVPTIAAAGKVSVIEAMVLGQQSGSVARPVTEPLPTVATDGAIAVVEPCIIDAAFGEGNETRRQQSVDQPLGTLPCSNRYGIAQPVIVAMEHGGRELSADNPLPTITTARGGAMGVAEAFVVSAGGANLRQPRSAHEPIPTVMGTDRLAVVEPCCIGLVEPVLITAGGPTGQARNANSVDEPLPTVLAENHRALVEPFLSTYYGNAGIVPVADPVPTITTKDRVALAEPFIVPNNTNNVAKSMNDPVPTITGANRLGLVQPVVNGMALDIRFRMLQPHELAAAMSFPKSYKFTGKREEIVKQIGNSWPGELSFALNLAIAKDYAPKKRSKKSEAAA